MPDSVQFDKGGESMDNNLLFLIQLAYFFKIRSLRGIRCASYSKNLHRSLRSSSFEFTISKQMLNTDRRNSVNQRASTNRLAVL